MPFSASLIVVLFFFLMIRRPPRSTLSSSSAASDVYKRQAYTWAENAHEFRLTPWSNDSVTDACGEAFYLRDEESGRFWSPTPLPAGSDRPYTSRHGFGYSVFEHTEDAVTSE